MIQNRDKKAFEESGMKEGNVLIKQTRDDSFINLETRSHKLTSIHFRNQNRMLY